MTDAVAWAADLAIRTLAAEDLLERHPKLGRDAVIALYGARDDGRTMSDGAEHVAREVLSALLGVADANLEAVAKRHYERLAAQPFGSWEKVPQKYKDAFLEQAREDFNAFLGD